MGGWRLGPKSLTLQKKSLAPGLPGRVLTCFPETEELGNPGLGGGDFQFRIPPAQGFGKAMLGGLCGCL